MTKTYKWDHPSEWLLHAISEHRSDTVWLVECLHSIVSTLDSDEIQDIFQSDMESDGYFKAEVEVSTLTREECTQLLNNVSIEVYDHESTETLREAVRVNIDDGTIDADRVFETGG